MTNILADIIEIFSRSFLKHQMFCFSLRFSSPLAWNEENNAMFWKLSVLPWNIETWWEIQFAKWARDDLSLHYFIFEIENHSQTNNTQQAGDYLEILIIRDLPQCHLHSWTGWAMTGTQGMIHFILYFYFSNLMDQSISPFMVRIGSPSPLNLSRN